MPVTADEAFVSAARATLDGMLERRPEMATELGDHRYDDRLTIGTGAYYEEAVRWCGDRLSDLRAVGTGGLSPQNRVDAQILANRLELIRFSMGELRDHEWNPLGANPGRAIYLLLARDFAPINERLRCVARRLAAIPAALAAAREVAGAMPAIHLQTALTQFAGTAHLLGAELDRAIASAPAGHDHASGEMAASRSAALEAIEEHQRWLRQRLAEAEGDGGRDPRIGAELFARKLRLTLDSESDAGEIVARAESDLERVTGEITETATRLAGPGPHQTDDLVRHVLDSLATDMPDNTTILGLVWRAFAQQLDFVHSLDLVTTYDDDPVQVIEMPEIDRGIAVAYCDPPGPLEPSPGPTFVAVSPTPQEWTRERADSFYREYNKHMVQNLMIHEGMPGHVLQLQHSGRFKGDTPIRAALRSGSFVEGWAVYSEQLMATRGYPGEGNPGALRMQQLKMQLRMIINTILDARVHCDGITETAAMDIMTRRGHQEEGEAAGKWRRALLTSAQLSTYYVGFTEVSDLAAALRRAHPEWPERQLHDAMLSHGSPAVRHLRTLLGQAG